MSLDADIATLVEDAVSRAVRPLADKLARLTAALEAPKWQSRRAQAEQDSCSVDTIDRRARPGGDLEVRRIGRRVLVRARPRPTDEQIAALAQEASRTCRK